MMTQAEIDLLKARHDYLRVQYIEDDDPKKLDEMDARGEIYWSPSGALGSLCPPEIEANYATFEDLAYERYY